MEPTEPIFRMKCADCGLPAVTFDELHVARCNRHATLFIPAVRVATTEDDERSMRREDVGSTHSDDLVRLT